MNELVSPDPDWTLWRSFEAVVAEGSLSSAARRLGLSQPTLGRHVEALEKQLGLALFDRTLKGLKPTEAGLKLYEPVRAARRALGEARAIAEGQSVDLAGSVRITASAIFSHHVLPGLLRPVRAAYPDVALEIVPSDSVENLLLREADIAIRMFRPTQLDLVTRRICDIPLVCCAHKSYLDRRGRPQAPNDLKKHDLIGLDRSDLIIAGARANGIDISRADFVLRTDSQTLGWALVAAGLGIGFAQKNMVDKTPGMEALLPQLAIPVLEVWLTAHRELFTSRRIRAIYDALSEALGAAFRAEPAASGKG
ncbi:MAG: LysR family transcriptional regulator [Alphaproteobacteria bacterium]|nr:LysR family transcriptional regulator [Alphaproteobacteria bacterium]